MAQPLTEAFMAPSWIEVTIGPDGTLVLDVSSKSLVQPGEKVSLAIIPHSADRGKPEGKSPEERVMAFRAWADSHPRDTPLLSDEAISRESIYGI